MSQLKQCAQSRVQHFKQNVKNWKCSRECRSKKKFGECSLAGRIWNSLVYLVQDREEWTDPNNDMKYLAVEKKKKKKEQTVIDCFQCLLDLD